MTDHLAGQGKLFSHDCGLLVGGMGARRIYCLKCFGLTVKKVVADDLRRPHYPWRSLGERIADSNFSAVIDMY